MAEVVRPRVIKGLSLCQTPDDSNTDQIPNHLHDGHSAPFLHHHLKLRSNGDDLESDLEQHISPRQVNSTTRHHQPHKSPWVLHSPRSLLRRKPRTAGTMTMSMLMRMSSRVRREPPSQTSPKAVNPKAFPSQPSQNGRVHCWKTPRTGRIVNPPTSS